jgi:hypothetical protein
MSIKGKIMEYQTLKEKMDELSKQFDEEAEKLSRNAIELVINQARIILQNDENLYEFIMAMGSCFFTVKDGGKYDPDSYDDEGWDDFCESDDYVRSYKGIIDDDDFHPEFFDLVDKLDEMFRVKGYPVRFTANSKEVHDWGDTIKNPVVYEERD